MVKDNNMYNILSATASRYRYFLLNKNSIISEFLLAHLHKGKHFFCLKAGLCLFSIICCNVIVVFRDVEPKGSTFDSDWLMSLNPIFHNWFEE